MCLVFVLQYMISALGDCVPVLQQVKHEASPQVMLDSFEKEISDTLHEVSNDTSSVILLYQTHFNTNIYLNLKRTKDISLVKSKQTLVKISLRLGIVENP